MSKSTWICFDCQTTVRRDNFGWSALGKRSVICSQCNKPCWLLGYKIPVPPKRDLKAWAALREQLSKARQGSDQEKQERAVRERSEITKKIRQLESRRVNPGRRDELIRLKHQLALLDE